MELLYQLWLPVFVMLFVLICSGAAWFVYVRSIEIPWDERNKKKNPEKE